MPPSTQHPLGPLIAAYRDRPLRWRDLLSTFLPASLAALTPLVYGLWRTYYARMYYGPAAANSWGRPWYALATAGLIPLLLLALSRVRRAHRVVQIHKNGIHIRGRRGRQHTLRWGEIGGIASTTLQDRFLGFTLRSRHRATLYPLLGKPIQLDSRLPNLDELTARVKARLYPRLLPELRTALRGGDQLYFGPVTLHTRAVHLRGREIPWEQVALINLRAGYLVVELHQQRAKKIPVGQIPNVELLIQLIQEGVDV